jgi:hypothetical protein
MKLSLGSISVCLALGGLLEPSHALRRRQLIQVGDPDVAHPEITHRAVTFACFSDKGKPGCGSRTCSKRCTSQTLSLDKASTHLQTTTGSLLSSVRTTMIGNYKDYLLLQPMPYRSKRSTYLCPKYPCSVKCFIRSILQMRVLQSNHWLLWVFPQTKPSFGMITGYVERLALTLMGVSFSVPFRKTGMTRT